MHEVTLLNSEESQQEYYDSIDVNKSRDIHKLEYKDKTLYIVGTAHVSVKSKLTVKKAIRELKPDLVCIELDQQRYDTLTDPKRWENIDIFSILKKKQTYLLIAQLALAGFQKRIGEKLGIKPGSEMLEAVNLAKENNIPISLVDRAISNTLKRAWKFTPFTKKILLLSNLLSSFFYKEDIDEDKLSHMRKSDIVTELINELNNYLPEAKKVLVDERDSYIVKKTLDNNEQKILLVVGAGHVEGIKEHINEEIVSTVNLDKLNEIPKSPLLWRSIPWAIPVLVFSLILVAAISGDYSKLLQGTMTWILSNGILSTIGAILALAHPVTIVLSFIAAPITSLIPVIGCGFVVAPIEAYLKKPCVIDFQNLSTDVSTLKGWYRNRLTKILLVFLFTSIGSAIGTFVALGKIIPWGSITNLFN